jgi:hypothetical protein
LYQAPDQSYEATKGQVALCKRQSKIVAERFGALHQRAATLLQTASDVSRTRTSIDVLQFKRLPQNLVEATREAAAAESRIERIRELEKVTDNLKANAQAVQNIRESVAAGN